MTKRNREAVKRARDMNLVDDALAGKCDLDEFRRKFGYEKSSEAVRAHKACQRLRKKLLSVVEEDLYELVSVWNELREEDK